jgi:hypothetical protein
MVLDAGGNTVSPPKGGSSDTSSLAALLGGGLGGDKIMKFLKNNKGGIGLLAGLWFLSNIFKDVYKTERTVDLAELQAGLMGQETPKPGVSDLYRKALLMDSQALTRAQLGQTYPQGAPMAMAGGGMASGAPQPPVDLSMLQSLLAQQTGGPPLTQNEVSI